MALSPGVRLGPYEILASLGAGGMGEAYRARDTRLNRDVAIKILPELFAADPDRVARFQRETQVLASRKACAWGRQSPEACRDRSHVHQAADTVVSLARMWRVGRDGNGAGVPENGCPRVVSAA